MACSSSSPTSDRGWNNNKFEALLASTSNSPPSRTTSCEKSGTRLGVVDPQKDNDADDIIELAEECQETAGNDYAVTKPPIGTLNSPRPASSTLTSAANPQKAAPVLFDPTFRIRVTNPRMTTQAWASLCYGSTKVTVGSLRPNQPPPVPSTSTHDGSWLTMGVIVRSTGVLKSFTPHQSDYMIWSVSDLKDANIVTAKVVLFGEAVREHWKLQVGMTVGLINPLWEAMEQDAGQSRFGSSGGGGTSNNGGGQPVAKMKVFKLSQVLPIGFCPDFGYCIAEKPSGERCKIVVNTTLTPFCQFHLQRAANTLIGSGNGGRGGYTTNSNTAFKRHTPYGVGDNHREPGGLFTQSSPTAIINLGYDAGDGWGQATAKKPKFVRPSSSLAASRAVAATPALATKPTSIFSKLKKAVLPLSWQQQSSANNGGFSPRREAKSLPQFREERRLQAEWTTTMKRGVRAVEMVNNGGDGETLAMKKARLEEENRKHAASVLNKNKKQQQQTSQAPGNNTKIAQPQQQVPSSDSFEPQPCEKTKQQPQQLPSSRGRVPLAPIGQARWTMEEMRALIATPSTHSREAEQVEHERQERYFAAKEMEERVETAATTTMEVRACRVVTCRECNYTSAFQSDYCKKEGHTVKRHTADKRFFRCKECGTRTTAYGTMMPTKPCQQCRSRNFERVAMRDERQVELETDKLLLRGEERKFLNR